MEQKTIWKAFLIIGISIMLLYSCNSRVEHLKTVNYIYKNTTGVQLVIEVYNYSDNLVDNYTIENNASVDISPTILEGPVPFNFDGNISTVTVKFIDNKCLYYSRNSNVDIYGDDIFDYRKYDNYNEELLNQDEYTLFYTITNQDYNDAINCN
jgi:hypothetical protein